MEQEVKRKGGRIPAKNFKFYGQDAIRSSNTRLAKSRFGSLAVDCIQCAYERMAQSDFAIFRLDESNLKRIELEDQISKEDFLKVLDYCTQDLNMFDEVLFKNKFLFSVDFVRTFDSAGLFRHRTYGLQDILRVANHYRPNCQPLTAEDELELIARGGVLSLDTTNIVANDKVSSLGESENNTSSLNSRAASSINSSSDDEDEGLPF